eukprot:TRINITY_DN75519_c0_g1_i1.p1 TRINITY_DN75519_c0_g1~~TRINITY_DN75519_c0_g1_i1.p1  ORF type:complete len:321 (+),score=25.35 TRINITY_DN75519_c0_g1_i1:41-1003(+)
MRSRKLLVCVCGIYTSFILSGLFLEDVFTYRSASGEAFKYAWFLQVVDAAAGVVLGYICNRYFDGGYRNVPITPYLITGSFQVWAKYFATVAVVHGVSFPVVALAKSAKLAPVMIGSLLVGKASYSIREYFNVALIICGTALLSTSGPTKQGTTSSALGLFFICASLTFDGVVGGVQKRLKRVMADNGVPEKHFEMQFLTNFFMLITALCFCVLTGEATQGCSFLIANPSVSLLILQVCLCNVFGQAFVFYTISTFDPVICTGVTTTRKVFSALLSIATKGHVVNFQGWSGIAIASCGVLSELGGNRFAHRSKAVAGESR